MAGLDLEAVRVWIGNHEILKGVDLNVAKGECLALLGPSGCGKTTTLRVIAGFTKAQQGQVRIAGRNVADTPPNKRNVGLVFQDYALFPHMTIAENVGYGLRMRGQPKSEIASRVAEALAMVQLEHVAARFPENLSGGQRQRVALARALVIKPDILLLDEPLGALDRKLRDQMQVELKQLQRRSGITTIIVTHDQEEALSLADRVAVMFNGAICEIGTPEVLYETPRSRAVMDFLGTSNIVVANLATPGIMVLPSGVQLARPQAMMSGGATATLGIRPEHVQLVDAAPSADTMTANLIECVYKGGLVEVHGRLADGSAIQINTTAAQAAAHGLSRQGATIRFRFPPERLQVLAD